MKQILISSCMFLFLLSANNIIAQEKVKEKDNKTKVKDKETGMKEKDKDGKMKMKNMGMNNNYPFTANYSSNFAVGNPAHAKMVLDIWKDWDDNALSRHNFMADTIVVYLPNGQVMKGKEAAMTGFTSYRNTITTSKSTVDAWMPLRSVDKKEDWVAIWGNETDTHADGKVDTTEIHEIWRINKAGKVDFIKQFSSKPAPQQ